MTAALDFSYLNSCRMCIDRQMMSCWIFSANPPAYEITSVKLNYIKSIEGAILTSGAFCATDVEV